MTNILKTAQVRSLNICDPCLHSIPTVQKDNALEFQSLFHWRCVDFGQSSYIRKACQHLNRKVKSSHLTDEQEFNQLIE